ncbi:hypothetical protein MKZ38_009425 [Zalerion maritima]|uniref:Uncharacterized protein n=1 Tax=Zalerion maritima TaxID=339359 RepID=A0AAD5WM30_9PEZI|nr:hypothetical protein MKZ38_009425 [Zalerion maritima]
MASAMSFLASTNNSTTSAANGTTFSMATATTTATAIATATATTVHTLITTAVPQTLPTSGNDYNGTNIGVAINGWVPTSNDRGTVDIMWSATLTIFLCVWVATYPNAPAPKDRWYHYYIDKANLALVCLLGPDLLLAIALGQLSNAFRSKDKFRDDPIVSVEKDKWTLRKAFFADMGGFHLCTPDYPGGFPIDAEQFHYLLKHGYTDFPDPKIWETAFNSIDILSRVITILQVVMFTATEIGRMKAGYPMTTLELTAFSFAFMMVATQAAWLYKPSVTSIIPLECDVSATAIRQRAKRDDPIFADLLDDVWYQTPLMFLSRTQTFSFGQHWTWNVYFAHLCGFKSVFSRRMRDPFLWDRLPTDIWFALDENRWWIRACGVGITIPFCFCLLPAWNWDFPTEGEKQGWRVVSVMHCSLTLIGIMWYVLASRAWNLRRKNRQRQSTLGPEMSATAARVVVDPWKIRKAPPLREFDVEVQLDQQQQQQQQQQAFSREIGGDSMSYTMRPSLRRRIRRFLDKVRNPSPDGDPKVYAQGRFVIMIVPVTLIYMVARLFLYGEDYAGLRQLPVGAYLTVNRFLPFLGS